MNIVRTGIGGLDELLGEGILRTNAILLTGAPGTGKTTLGLQFVVKGIMDYGEPGLILTFEEFPETLYRDAANFSWDLKNLEQKGMLRLLFTSPEMVLEEIEQADGFIMQAVREIGARRVLIDSATLMNALTPDTWARRKNFYALVNLFRREGITPVIIKEASHEQSQGPLSFEEYTVDCVIQVSNEVDETRNRRRLIEIIKARGQDFVRGKHAFRIDHRGIVVYPFMPPRAFQLRPAEPLGMTRESSGIAGLDKLMSGGYLRGCTAMVSGATGTGKTTMALHFTDAAARNGDPVLWVTAEESPQKLKLFAEGLGIDLAAHVEKGLVNIEHLTPYNINASRLYRNILRDIEEKGYRRLVIDSITDLENSMPSEIPFRDWTTSLADALELRAVTTLMTNYVPEMFGNFTIMTPSISMFVDTIIFLRYVEIESVICKGMTVVKMRGSRHDRDIVRYDIVSGEGIVVRERFHGLEQVIAGVTRQIPMSQSNHEDEHAEAE